MAVIKHTDQNGIPFMREVPATASKSDYGKGVLLGPPDFSSLDLTREEQIKLNEALIEAGFLSYGDVKGHKAELVNVLRKVFSADKISSRVLDILRIYQTDWYPDKFGE